MRPESQIKSYIEDALRSSVPKLTLMNYLRKKMKSPLRFKTSVEEMSTWILCKNLDHKVEPRYRSETIHERD